LQNLQYFEAAPMQKSAGFTERTTTYGCAELTWQTPSRHPLSNAERRTPNAERRTPNAERRTPNAERRTP
jgi:hypothetical protein